MADLKLGLAQGYWGAAPHPDFLGIAQEAENLGFDSVWSAEAWGNDAFTPLAWMLPIPNRFPKVARCGEWRT